MKGSTWQPIDFDEFLTEKVACPLYLASSFAVEFAEDRFRTLRSGGQIGSIGLRKRVKWESQYKEGMPMLVAASLNLGSADVSRLLEAAKAAASNAYAPYSHFTVGAAVLTENGTVYTGCNVENASYGLTICAERVAIFSAVAVEGIPQLRIRALLVYQESGTACTPCGACRQVIHEFAPDSVVIFRGKEGFEQMLTRDLLPGGFSLRAR